MTLQAGARMLSRWAAIAVVSLGMLLVGLVMLPFILFSLPFLAILVLVVMAPPHTQRQPCTHCNRKAKYVSETVHEGQGRRSWTDLVIAEYRCPNGHVFVKNWTASAWGD